MSDKSKELQEALLRYTTDTLTDIHQVRTFCEKSSKWLLNRESELNMMMDIKDRADRIDLSIGHVTGSQEKGKAFLDYMKSKFNMTASRQRAELEGELTEVLKDTLLGLQELESFLEAVEKLAATSLHVFSENPALRLPEGVGLDYVQVVVLAAKHICPLVLDFKSDAERFFVPKLHNVEVLVYQLHKYNETIQDICQRLDKSSFSDFCLETVGETEVDVSEDFSEDEVQRMLDHINQLDEIRVDPNFQLAFLFQQEFGQHFINEFDKRQPQMLQFLNELEETAVQLDRMNKGAKISSVAGSSVGATGGVLSIIGLALMPVTMGVSLGLTLAGLSMGFGSGVNSLVTTATEIGVNTTQQKKASQLFQNFMEDVINIQNCVDMATASRLIPSDAEMAVGISRVLIGAGVCGKGIDSIVDAASSVNLVKSEEIVSGTSKVLAEEAQTLRNVPKIASDIPDIGQAAAKSTVALSNSARAGFIGLNALFLGVDVFVICKDSISLAKGSETETSQFIRSRAALWSSVMDSWQEMRDSLHQGLPTSEKKEAVLETPFYPESDVKKLHNIEEEELAKEEPNGVEPTEAEPAKEEPVQEENVQVEEEE